VRLIIALASAWVAGCISDPIAPCAGDYSCPAGDVCDLAHAGCVKQDQLDACATSGRGV